MFGKQKPWWHFWNPMSGLEGGLVMGAVISIVFGLVVLFLDIK